MVDLANCWAVPQTVGDPVTRRDRLWSPSSGEVDEELLAFAGGPREWLPEFWVPTTSPGTPPRMIRGAVVGPGTGDNMGAGAGAWPHARYLAISFVRVHGVRFIEHADVGPSKAKVAASPTRGTLLAARVHVDATRSRVGGRSHAARTTISIGSEHSLPGGQRVVLVPTSTENGAAVATATGSLSGLRTSTTIADIVRASVEGVICGTARRLDAWSAATVDTNGRILAVGGGARSTLYRKVLADLSTREIGRPTPPLIRVAVGAAAQAAAV